MKKHLLFCSAAFHVSNCNDILRRRFNRPCSGVMDSSMTWTAPAMAFLLARMPILQIDATERSSPSSDLGEPGGVSEVMRSLGGGIPSPWFTPSGPAKARGGIVVSV